jgi:acetyl-CoA synthetase
MLNKKESLEAVRSEFVWNIPERYNMGVDVCDRWSLTCPDQVAIIHDDGSGSKESVEEITYQDLKSRSNQLANLLTSLGVSQGDRVGILLPQHPWTAVSHISAWKMGAISIPLFTLFGEEALEYRLTDSSARVIVTNAEGARKITAIRDRCPDLEHVLCIDATVENRVPGAINLSAEVKRFSEFFVPLDTFAEDPALIIYTSGTTGNPKGALHAQRTLLGHLPGVEMSHDFLPQPGDKIWTPADWAWIGGLMDVLMPALHHGIPTVSCRFEKFSGETAVALINKHGIRNAFLPPTALKMMRMAGDDCKKLKTPMRSIASAGEALGAELLEWGKETFGIWINEFYGQTECNMIVSSCGCLEDPQPGVMGYAVPGHDVQVISANGDILEPGKPGQIAVRGKPPVMFLGYWNNPQKTREKFTGEWMFTGDTGMLEKSGALRFVGRDDDVITSSGYRIGPGEIENCLLGHPAVAISAVVGKPDPLRTEIVKAFVQLNDGYVESDTLADELKQWVKVRLSAHEYPREVAFVDDFPMTTTGKIIRRKLREIA